MTTIDIDAIRQREQAADSGPWRVVEEHGRDIADEGWSRITIQTAIRYGESAEITELADPDHDWASKLTEENAEFIAHARTDVPALLAKVDELTAELATTRDAYDKAARQWAHARAEVDRLHEQLANARHTIRNLAQDYADATGEPLPEVAR